MPATYVTVENSLKIGILNDVAEMWEVMSEKEAQYRSLMFHDVPWVPQYTSKFVWKQDVGMPVPWDKGSELPANIFDDVAIDCDLREYGQRTEWFRRDNEFDQLQPGQIRKHAEMGIKRYAQLYRYLGADYLDGTTNYIRYPQLAYDGAALFSATDGAGADRMGVSGGNIVTSSGLSTAAIKTDAHRALQRWLGMKQPISNHPVFSPDEVKFENMLFVIPPALEERFFDLSEAKILYTDPSINTAQSNTLATRVKYEMENVLTDSSDYYVILQHSYWKPFLYRGLSSIDSFIADASNSDDARKLNIEAWFSQTMMGCCPWAMFTMIKINVA